MKRTSNKYITATIDGEKVRVRKGLSILQAARQAKIYIPALCYLDNLKAYGGCRLCTVDVKNMKGFPTACTTPIEQDMEIRTKTPELQKLRTEILELILSEHPYTCLVCKDKENCTDFMYTTRKVGTITGCNFCSSNGDCELQTLVDYLGLKEIKYPVYYKGIPPEKNNPFYDLDYNLCILCGRCVRICNEERNSQVLAFIQRGNNTIVGTAFNESQKDAGCEFCGACVDVCPTGSISEKMGKWAGLPDKTTESTCILCPVGCRININTRGNRIVNIGPKPGARTNPPQICLRGKFVPADINHHPSRLTTPLIRKNNKWAEVNWDEAVKYTAGKLKKYTGSKFGMICSPHDTVEDNYILQKFSRKVMKSNNVDMFSSYPGREIPDQLHAHYSVYSPPGIDEIEKADTLLMLGTDASISHPMAENRIRKAFNLNKQIIYANAFPTRTSNFATQNIIYSPGEEQNLLYVLLSELAGKNISALPEKFTRYFVKKDKQTALDMCGVAETEISQAAGCLDRSGNLLIIVGDALLRSASGRDNLQILENIHAIKRIKHKCNLLFLEYEGNLHGGIFAGIHPGMLPGFDHPENEKHVDKWNHNWQTRLSGDQGLTSDEMLGSIRNDGISAMFVVGNLPASPKLKNLKFLVQFNMFRTGLSEYADVIFPVTSFLENDGHTLTMDRQLKKIKKAVPAPEHVRNIAWIISKIAGTMKETGFSKIKSKDILREMQSFAGTPSPGPEKQIPKFVPVKPKPGKTDKDFPVRLILHHNHFRYRGTGLSSLVEDLKEVIDENKVGLSPQLIKQYKVQEGDKIRVITEYGESQSIIKSLRALNGNTARLFPGNDDIFLLTGRLNPDQTMINARIEKI
jgi:formate dehydrogenase alpha subunit